MFKPTTLFPEPHWQGTHWCLPLLQLSPEEWDRLTAAQENSHGELYNCLGLALIWHTERCWKHFNKSFLWKRLLLYTMLCQPLMWWFLCRRSCRKVWMSCTLILFRQALISLMHIIIGLSSMCELSLLIIPQMIHQALTSMKLSYFESSGTVRSKVLSGRWYIISSMQWALPLN